MNENGNEKRYAVGVCTGMTCSSRFARDIYQKFLSAARSLDLQESMKVEERGCCGKCVKGPNLMVAKGDYEGTEVLSADFLEENREKVFIYSGISANDVHNIIKSHIMNGNPIQQMLYCESESQSGAQPRQASAAAKKAPIPRDRRLVPLARPRHKF